MNPILFLLCAYAVCFGLQHKIGFFHGKSQFTDSLLACTYCTGFHAGWITYGLIKALDKIQGIESSVMYSDIFIYSFASSIFCYMVDVVVQFFER